MYAKIGNNNSHTKRGVVLNSMKILIFGDSLTQGRSDPEYFGWSNRLAIWSQQEAIRTDWEIAHLVCNMGNAGDTSTDVLARFEQEFIWRRGGGDALVIFQVGINDAAHVDDLENNLVTISDTIDNITQLIKQANQLAENVVVLGMTRVDESKVNPYIDSSTGKSWLNVNIDKYDQAIELRAKELDIKYISLKNIVNPLLCEDGLHPNAEGHRLIYERVKAVLEEAGIL